MTTETIRVLIVEDSPLDTEVVSLMLRSYPRLNFELRAVGSTQECMGLLSEQSFDLLLLDNNLPGEDGLSFLRRLDDAVHVPPVIMLTGVGDERLAVEALHAGAYDYFPKQILNSEVLAHAIHQTLEKFRLNEQLERTEQVIFTLAAAVEAKDPTTRDHIDRMARHAVQLGQALELSEHQLTLLRYGGILHDIGKVGVSEAILGKPGPLTEDEWVKMRQHPIIGERICAPLRFSNEVGPIIRHHHERWDGRGYVDALSGEQIPLLARVIGVVDAFDAMSYDRPYRKALPFEEIVFRLSEGAGAQWDPHLTGVFLELVKGGALHKEQAVPSGNGRR